MPKIQNLHTKCLTQQQICKTIPPNIIEQIQNIRGTKDLENIHKKFIEITEELYNAGFSANNLTDFIKKSNIWTDNEIINTIMYFEKVKVEYRSEKLLIFAILDFIFFRG